jgi:hypothetical protein
MRSQESAARPRTPAVARVATFLAVLLGPLPMLIWWIWAWFDSEHAVFVAMPSLVCLQLLAACAVFVARRWSRSWLRPRALPLLVLYLAAVAALAGWLAFGFIDW